MKGTCCATARVRLHDFARVSICLGKAAAKQISASLLTATGAFKAPCGIYCCVKQLLEAEKSDRSSNNYTEMGICALQ
jgi:hypothetical protein